MAVIVSGCLLGKNCNYKKTNCFNPSVLKAIAGKTVISVCPEVQGGLPIPRPASERLGKRVVSIEGKDVTEEFERGALRAWEYALASKEPIEGAILRHRSPSCGVHEIYDGTFSGAKIPGQGVFVDLLKEKGIPVFDEDDDLSIFQKEDD